MMDMDGKRATTKCSTKYTTLVFQEFYR